MRDLAKEFDKQITLEIEGEETELDKSLIEEIGDPLVHLIRNAADHGIESPEARIAQGKSATGTVKLSAAHEGNHIVISISDDGAGMDAEALKAKAIERGTLTAREASEMSEAEAFQLIFRAGFSTAKTVSKVSGRGVGMDVVKTNITRLNGTISIHSAPGQGSTFILRLPLTLAIIQSLLVRVERETFAIPLHSVVEVVSLAKHPLSTINGREVIRLREQVLPLIRTGEALEVAPCGDTMHDRKNVVVVAIGHHRLGFVVDELIGQKEIVIKPLGSYLKKVPGVAGSTILGDGRVILIIDIGELLRMHSDDVRKGSPRRQAEATA
jgi:two-component system, chemotaxis family, sensor kinase CheA